MKDAKRSASARARWADPVKRAAVTEAHKMRWSAPMLAALIEMRGRGAGKQRCADVIGVNVCAVRTKLRDMEINGGRA